MDEEQLPQFKEQLRLIVRSNRSNKSWLTEAISRHTKKRDPSCSKYLWDKTTMIVLPNINIRSPNFDKGIHSKNITGSWIPRHTISQPSSSQLPIIKEKGPHLSGYLSTRSSAQAEPPLSVNTFRNYVFTYNPRTLPAATIPSSTRPIQVVKWHTLLVGVGRRGVAEFVTEIIPSNIQVVKQAMFSLSAKRCPEVRTVVIWKKE